MIEFPLPLCADLTQSTLAGDRGQNVDVFRPTHCEHIPDATSSQNELSTDAHPNILRDVPEETRSSAQWVYTRMAKCWDVGLKAERFVWKKIHVSLYS